MPPFLPRKRLRTPSPEARSSSSGGKGTKDKPASTRSSARRPTLFDALDAGLRNDRTSGDTMLQKIQAASDSSSLSSFSTPEFEDIPNTQRAAGDSDEDEDEEFEDVPAHVAVERSSANVPTGDLELTLTRDERVSLTNTFGKKGPSKIERGIRIATHQMHVQFLMWHNAIRNSWLCDQELQAILVSQLPAEADKEIEKFRRRSGIGVEEKQIPIAKTQEKGKGKGKDQGKGMSREEKDLEGSKKARGKGKAIEEEKADPRRQRDWGQPAQRLEVSAADLKHHDPLNHLMKYLRLYWAQRFRIVTHGLRKHGYMSLERLDQEMKSFRKDSHDPRRHGERITDVGDLRDCARAMEGSRDISAQLFTALVRGLSIEARMVASLQPVGFGWNKNEDAVEKKEKKGKELDDEHSEEEQSVLKPPTKSSGKKFVKSSDLQKSSRRRASRAEGVKNAPIDLDDSDDAIIKSDSDSSVVDITPLPVRRLPSKSYDKDLLFPHYWTEVLSPVSNTYTAVDPAVLNTVAGNAATLAKFEIFEARGLKAEKAKQVTAYIVGHSPDGTAKDVTIRYLKNHTLPGTTKGNRLPVEKRPVYNARGKIKHYEKYDWFKAVMRAYGRGSKKCPRTDIDDHEEATDLRAVQPQKKEVKEGAETLAYYKTSAEFVLERHLRREEAILPQAEYVKMFTVKGKGDTTTEEKVWLRKDVVSCKSMETWHKEGRAPLHGEEPRKRVPYRAATTTRKRELAEAEHVTGEKMLQGLFSRDQTDWIIPAPIENGVIPKNNYGNMDVYVPSMVPMGAVHIPKRGTKKICTKLGIDFAEAVTGFEFGARMAIPIITGVVVAAENEEMVYEQWVVDEAERVRKEDEKRTKAAIGLWRRFLMGLRIVERVREEYGDELEAEADAANPWTNLKGKSMDRDAEAQKKIMEQRDEDMAGGFFPEGHDEEEVAPHHAASFFPVAEDGDAGGGFMVEDETAVSTGDRQRHLSPQSTETKPQESDSDDEEMEDATAIAPNARAQPRKSAPIIASSDDGDEEDEESEPEATALAPKSRGRPRGSVSKTAKAEAPAKENAKAKAAPKSNGKRKRQAADAEEEDEVGYGEQSVSKTPVAKRKATGKANEGSRKTPKRGAKRGEVRSKYFEAVDDDDDE